MLKLIKGLVSVLFYLFLSKNNNSGGNSKKSTSNARIKVIAINRPIVAEVFICDIAKTINPLARTIEVVNNANPTF